MDTVSIECVIPSKPENRETLSSIVSPGFHLCDIYQRLVDQAKPVYSMVISSLPGYPPRVTTEELTTKLTNKIDSWASFLFP